jgi:hypothetical protein
MHDELDPFVGRGNADLDRLAGSVAANEHCEVVELEHSDRMVVGVEDASSLTPCLRALATMTGSTGVNLP